MGINLIILGPQEREGLFFFFFDRREGHFSISIIESANEISKKSKRRYGVQSISLSLSYSEREREREIYIYYFLLLFKVLLTFINSKVSD